MKQAQNARNKQRGRPSSRQGGKSGGPGNRSEQKIRGNPKQLVEKYKNQAREALQAGDRTQAEYYFQFADHYYRIVNERSGGSQNEADGSRNDSRRRRRGRGQQDDQSQQAPAAEPASADTAETKDAPVETAKAPEADVNGAKQDSNVQPTEVHPELNLGDDQPKPARKRRAPRKKPEPAPEATAPEVAAAVAE